MINSDNSIQINIKFTFTVHEYIIVYEYILLSNFIYIYIYIYITNFVLFVYCNIVATHTYDGHISHSHDLFQVVLLAEMIFHIHMIFSRWFY